MRKWTRVAEDDRRRRWKLSSAWSSVAFAWALATALLPVGAKQALAAPTEYELKAALLYNFARFAEWPDDSFASSSDPFVIAIVGPDPFGSLLDQTVEGRKIEGRPITVERWLHAESVEHCHVLFVGFSDRAMQQHTLDALKTRAVLTVSDEREFADHGGTIGLDLEDERVRMTINMSAVRGTGIRISSKLLALSRLIEDAP